MKRVEHNDKPAQRTPPASRAPDTAGFAGSDMKRTPWT
jgi:hypothetical protein